MPFSFFASCCCSQKQTKHPLVRKQRPLVDLCHDLTEIEDLERRINEATLSKHRLPIAYSVKPVEAKPISEADDLEHLMRKNQIRALI